MSAVTRQTRPWLMPLAVAVAALAVYGLTLAPDLSWANAATDGGELITASYTLGVPHPPGYPTYVLLGKAFSYLPWGTVALRYNLFSAVCAAVAAGLLAATIGRWWANNARVSGQTAAVAALSFAFAPLVWGQAVVAEVYALNVLVLAAFLFFWSGRGPSALGGVWLGLAVTTHLTSLLMLPAAFLAAGQRGRLALGLALGLTPLLLLPLLARGDSPVIWGRPDTVAGWWWLVSGQLYHANLQWPPDGERVLGLLRALGPMALAAGRLARPAILGVWQANLERSPILWVATAGLYVLFALAYATADAAVLLLPALLLAALLVAPALGQLGLARWLLPLALLAVGLSGRAGDATAQTQPRAAAEALLAAAPPDAVLLTPGDRTIFTFWYLQHVEGLRPDVQLVDASLFAFDWYRTRLAQESPTLRVPAGDNLGALQVTNAAARPFCAVGLQSSPPLPLGTGDYQPHPTILCTEELP